MEVLAGENPKKVIASQQAANRDAIVKYLEDKEVPRNAIYGIVGNIDKETGGTFDYQQQQKNGPGYGLFQLDPGGGHQKEYSAFLERGGREDSMEAQLDYFLESIYDKNSPARESLGSGNADELTRIFSEGTTGEVTQAIMDKWEKPRDYIDKDKGPVEFYKYRKNLIERQTSASMADITDKIINRARTEPLEIVYTPRYPNRQNTKVTRDGARPNALDNMLPEFSFSPVIKEEPNKTLANIDAIAPIFIDNVKYLQDAPGIKAKFARKDLRKGRSDRIADAAAMVIEKDGKFLIAPALSLEDGSELESEEAMYEALMKSGQASVSYPSREAAEADKTKIFESLIKDPEVNPYIS